METANKTVFELLSEISNNQTYDLVLSNGETQKFKHLTASHLKDLIETVVDTSINQNAFADTCNKIFKECLVNASEETFSYNVLDRILFVIESRIQAVSSKVVVKTEDKSTDFDLNEIKQKLISTVKEKPEVFKEQKFSENSIQITCGLPTLLIDSLLNTDLEKRNSIDTGNEEDVRKLLGDAFINELAKSVRSITIQDAVLDLSAITFEERVKTVEKLPASLINNVITYIETYKTAIEGCLTKENTTLALDGSLFSIR